MTKPRIVYSPKYQVNYGDHAFVTSKFSLAARSLETQCVLVEPEEPSRDDLLLAHDSSWVEKIISARLSPDDLKRLELPFSSDISLAHRLAGSRRRLLRG